MEALVELQELEADLRCAELALARERYEHFAEYAIPDQSTGQPIQLCELQRAWFDHVRACHDSGLHAGILAPWGHGKTSHFGVGWPLWQLGRNAATTCKIICSGNEEAVKRTKAARSHIVENGLVRDVFAHLKPSRHERVWRGGGFTIDRPEYGQIEPSYEAKGLLQSGMGPRVHHLVFDDPEDLRKALSPKCREVGWEIYQTKWMSRLHPGCLAIHITTALHEKDIPHRIMNGPQSKAWRWLIQRVSADCTSIECEVV